MVTTSPTASPFSLVTTFKILQTYAFSDEINFEKLKKVFKNLIEGVKIWTPVTLTFFMINPN